MEGVLRQNGHADINNYVNGLLKMIYLKNHKYTNLLKQAPIFSDFQNVICLDNFSGFVNILEDYEYSLFSVLCQF